MNLHISGHHVEVTPALRKFVTEKLQRLTRHMDRLLNVDVILAVDTPRHDARHGATRHKAEARLHVSGGDLFAESIAPDMYAAIDLLMDKLDRQVSKFKNKRYARRPREAARGVTLH